MNIHKGYSGNFIKKTQSVLGFFFFCSKQCYEDKKLVATKQDFQLRLLKMGHQLHAQQADTS